MSSKNHELLSWPLIFTWKFGAVSFSPPNLSHFFQLSRCMATGHLSWLQLSTELWLMTSGSNLVAAFHNSDRWTIFHLTRERTTRKKQPWNALTPGTWKSHFWVQKRLVSWRAWKGYIYIYILKCTDLPLVSWDPSSILASQELWELGGETRPKLTGANERAPIYPDHLTKESNNPGGHCYWVGFRTPTYNLFFEKGWELTWRYKTPSLCLRLAQWIVSKDIISMTL